jgi:hypothetical protein
MKIIFNLALILIFLVAFVPSFRRFLFWLLVGRKLVNEQKRTQKAKGREGEIRVETRPPADNTRFKGGDYVDYEEVKE